MHSTYYLLMHKNTHTHKLTVIAGGVVVWCCIAGASLRFDTGRTPWHGGRWRCGCGCDKCVITRARCDQCPIRRRSIVGCSHGVYRCAVVGHAVRCHRWVNRTGMQAFSTGSFPHFQLRMQRATVLLVHGNWYIEDCYLIIYIHSLRRLTLMC